VFYKGGKDTIIDEYLNTWLTEHKDKYSCELSGGNVKELQLLRNVNI
jgi:hypothetical protein